MNVRITVFALLLALSVVLGYEKSYKGYTVLRCNMKETNLMNQVLIFSEQNQVDVWSINTQQKSMDLNLSPHQMLLFLSAFKERSDLTCQVYLEDVQAVIDEEEVSMKKLRTSNSFFDTYRSYEEIEAWMRSLAANNSFLYIVTVGNTTQGRTIYGVEMNGGGDRKRGGQVPRFYFQVSPKS